MTTEIVEDVASHLSLVPLISRTTSQWHASGCVHPTAYLFLSQIYAGVFAGMT